MNSYSAPARIDELTAADLVEWNKMLVGLFDSQIDVAKKQANPDSLVAWMFDPITGATQAALATKSPDWTAFPKAVSDSQPQKKLGWAAVDADRNLQEEYCEWEVVRNAQGKVIRVTLTCETEDYYSFLAAQRPDLLVQLYQKHVSSQVKLNDLVAADGTYDPQNRWSFPQNGGMRGLIMHMGQVNNTFGAAVNLAAVATWPRTGSNGQPLLGEQELIKCARFGDPRRHSDPHIGFEINKLVREGNEIAFADPVGLYIDQIDTSEWELPGNANVAKDKLITVVRGSAAHMLRVLVQAPEGANFDLGDVRIDGDLVQFGSQIAGKTKVRLTGIARAAANPAPSLQCNGGPAHTLLSSAMAELPQLLNRTNTRLASTVSVLSPE